MRALNQKEKTGEDEGKEDERKGGGGGYTLTSQTAG